MGLIPPFKNSKMIARRGKQWLLITKPEYQKRLEEITESLRLQLLSGFQTGAGETLTGYSLRSAIASSTPEDDAWTHIPRITIQAELCAPGEEGATIVIERLTEL